MLLSGKTEVVLKRFQAIINLVLKFYNTIESPLRILYFTPNFTDMLFCAIYQTHTRVTLDITAVLHTVVHEYTLKSAYHTVKKGCDSHEDPRRSENGNPLREVAIKLLPSTPCSMTLLDNHSPLTSNHLESP